MRTHKLKIWPEAFSAVRANQKRAEIRKNDRKFMVGDTVRLQEWDPLTRRYTGQEEIRKIAHIQQGTRFGIRRGHVLISMKRGTEL